MRQDVNRLIRSGAVACLLAMFAFACATPVLHAAEGLWELDAKGVPADATVETHGNNGAAEARGTDDTVPPTVKVTSGVVKLAFNKRAKGFDERVDSFNFKGSINPGDLLIAGLALDEFENELATICLSLSGESTAEFELGLPSKVRGQKVTWASNFPGNGGVTFTLDTLTGAFSIKGTKTDLSDSDSANNVPAGPLSAGRAAVALPTDPFVVLTIKLGTPDPDDTPYEGNAALYGVYKLRKPDVIGTWTYKYGRLPNQPEGGIFLIEKMVIEQRAFKGELLIPAGTGRGDFPQPEFEVRARIWACLRGPDPGDIDPSASLGSVGRSTFTTNLRINNYFADLDGVDFVASGINYDYVNPGPDVFSNTVEAMTFDNKRWKFYAETIWLPVDNEAFVTGAGPRLPAFFGFGVEPITDARTDPRRNLFIAVILTVNSNVYASPTLLGRQGTSWVLQGKSAFSPAPDETTIGDVESQILGP